MPDTCAKPGQCRRIGLIGGMSWRSTMLYYQRLNCAFEARLGAHHSFKGHIWNLDFAELLSLASRGDWSGIEAILVHAAEGLSRLGCEVVVLTAVTAHRWHPAVKAAGTYRVPHVLDAATQSLEASGARKIGVLGTSVTCGSDFVRERLVGRGRDLLFLDDDTQAEIDALIQKMLTASNDVTPGRATLHAVVERFRSRGAEAILLACTELPLLLPIPVSNVPLIDCVALHVENICNCILSPTHAD